MISILDIIRTFNRGGVELLDSPRIIRIDLRIQENNPGERQKKRCRVSGIDAVRAIHIYRNSLLHK